MSIEMRQRAQELLEGVPSEFLPDIIKTLEAFYEEPRSSEEWAGDDAIAEIKITIKEPTEAELIERITAPQPFDEKRLAELQVKQDAGTLPGEELFEWQQLKVAADSWKCKHKAALVKLSSLRGVTVPEIQAEFGLEVSKHPPLAQQLLELGRICREEDYTLIVPERFNRPTPFDFD